MRRHAREENPFAEHDSPLWHKVVVKGRAINGGGRWVFVKGSLIIKCRHDANIEKHGVDGRVAGDAPSIASTPILSET